MSTNQETLRLLQSMRAEVGSITDSLVRANVAAWVAAWEELASVWDAALVDLAAAGEDGRWPTRGQVMRADRAMRALDATRDRLETLAAAAGVRTVEALPDLTTLAAQWEARLVAAQMPPTAGPQAQLAVRFDRVDPVQLEAIVTRTTQQITALTYPLSVEATQAVTALLVRGVAVGDNPRVTARRMLARVEGGFNGGLTRALVIARTETLDAHRAAAHAQDQANTDVLTGWTWAATLDTRTCPSCLAQHGTVFPTTDPGPLDHQQGRCARLPKTRSWRDLGFDIDEPPDLLPDARAWFDKLPEDDQVTVMGPARLELLKAGQVSWDDLSRRRTTPGWRDSFTVTPLRDLRAA